MKVLNTKIFRVEADANAGERLDKNEVHRMMEEAYPEACEIVVKRIRTGVVFKVSVVHDHSEGYTYGNKSTDGKKKVARKPLK